MRSVGEAQATRSGHGRRAWATWAILLSTAAVACSGGKKGAPTGVARVVVQAEPTCGIERVVLTVSPGDGPAFQPFTTQLSRSGGRWSGRIEGIPAGPDRLFEAIAYGGADEQLLSGSILATIEAGKVAVVTIALHCQAPPPFENAFPVIDGLSYSSQYVAPGGSLQVHVTAHDPDGDALAFTWRASCGTFDDRYLSGPTWTAPGSIGECTLTVTVSDGRGAAVTASLPQPIRVTSDLGGVEVDVVLNLRPVVGISGSITLGLDLVGDLDVSALDPEGDPLTYAWTSDCLGVAFDLDPPHGPASPRLTVPGPSESCEVRVAVSDSPIHPGTIATVVLPPNVLAYPCLGVTCQTGQHCDPVDGQCKPDDACAGVTCPVLDPCHLPGTCSAGVCSPETPRTCATAGELCDPADGLCKPAIPADPCAGVTCDPSDPCHVAGTCSAGVCSPEAPKPCAAGEVCDLVDGVCKAAPDTVVANEIAKAIQLNRVDGLAAGAAASYLSGTSVFLPAKVVDGIPIAGAGASDVFLAAYDMATGLPTWAKAYGDELEQFGKDSTAATADGTVAVIGRLANGARLGECTTVGTTTTCSGVVYANPNGFETDFLLLADAATGAMKTGTRAVNDGISGMLGSVAVNPGLNLVAVCGWVSATSELAPGVAYQGGASDLLVAVFDSAGALQWARQVGSSTGAGDESCNAVAIADDGTVYAAGKYMDELDLGTGALPSLNNVTNVRHMWLAHFDGTGTTLAATAFGTPALRCANNPLQACTTATAATDCGSGIVCNANPVGNVTPNDLELDSAGNLVVGGSFTASFPVGGLASAGGTDAFVVKLSPAFAPAWGVRLGNTGADVASAVAIAPLDDVIAVGSYSATASGSATTGAAALGAPAGGANNAFVLKLDGTTGATHSAGGYGDASGQLASDVAVRGNRVQLGGITAGVLDFGAPTTPISTGTASTAFTTFADLQ